MTRILLPICQLILCLACCFHGMAEAQLTDRKTAASGRSPRWLRHTVPNTILARGVHADSIFAKEQAFRQARGLIIGKILEQHLERMADQQLSSEHIQLNFQLYLLQNTPTSSPGEVLLPGIELGDHLLQNRYFEIRREAISGLSSYHFYLLLNWPDHLNKHLSDQYYHFDRQFSEILETAAYYLDKSTAIGMLHFQIDRLATLQNFLFDYRVEKANRLIQAYRQFIDSLELSVTETTEQHFRVQLGPGTMHLTGSSVGDLTHDPCLRTSLLGESDAGFLFQYDESRCPPAESYEVQLTAVLPNGSERVVTMALPGNRVAMRTAGSITVHHFNETNDGYLEMSMVALSNQNYFIREIHFNGLRFSLTMNNRGRSIKGSGTYLLRAPISGNQMQQLLKMARKKSIDLTGGLIYSHPTSGIEIDFCFENLPWEIKKHD